MSTFAKMFFGTGATVLGIAALASLAGMRVNVSGSIPLGFYWMSGAPLSRGAYVIFCPPKTDLFDAAKQRDYIGAGFCPGGYGYVAKRVAAMPGDFVSIDGDGVRVNDVLLSCSAPMDRDNWGRELPRQHHSGRLGTGQVLLMSDRNPIAFDARYFGPLDQNQVESVVRPIFTWGGANASVHC